MPRNKNKRIFTAKMHFDKAELAGRVSLGASGVSMPMLAEQAMLDYKQDFSKTTLDFGMFGNDPKFYGNAADVAPKPEDFIEVPFRLISATTVGAGSWKATDFSDVRMLKKSTDLLDGVPLYKDHETGLDNWVGIVNGVKWTKSFVDDSGLTIPAGIDGIVAIDKVTNPKVARGVMLGAIYSNSVTVEFDWEMSHEFENEWDFHNKVGTFGADGKMIRRIAKTIHNYHESSLVWLGADPFAKAIDDKGNHKSVDVSSIYNYAKQSYKASKGTNWDSGVEAPKTVEECQNLTINFALDKNVLSLARRKTPKFNKLEDMKEFIIAFQLAFGKDLGIEVGATPTSEQMVEYAKQLSFVSPDEKIAVQKKIDELSTITACALEEYKKVEGNEEATEVDMVAFMADHTFVGTATLTSLEESAAKVIELEADKTALDAKVVSLTANAEIGKKYIGMQRAEAVRLYKVAVGAENADASVVAMFNKADDGAVEGLLKQYTKTATAKFSGTCGDCGSTKFKFRSSLTDNDDDVQLGNEAMALTTDEMYIEYTDTGMNIGRTKE